MSGRGIESDSNRPADTGPFSLAPGTVTFYADNRCNVERRQCEDRRKAPRITVERRSQLDRRQQTMTWNNGYQFQTPHSNP